GPEVPWVCEKSYENPFSSDSVTRIDDTINFGRSDWNLSFFNSLRFNFYPWEKGNIVRDRLPFASTWRGTVDSAEERVGEVLYVGEGELRISGLLPIQLPPRYDKIERVSFGLPAGRHSVLLTYKFDDGSRVADGKPRGPMAVLRVRARDVDSDRG